MENDRLKKICTGRVTMPAIAVLVNLMWGSAVIFIKKGYAAFEIAAGSTFDELLFASVRFLLAGVMILAVCRLTHQDLRLHRAWIPGILQVGLFQTTLQYLFYYIGVSHTPASISSILVSTSAFIVVLPIVLNQLLPGAFNLVLGAELARQLGVHIGDQVTLVVPSGQPLYSARELTNTPSVEQTPRLTKKRPCRCMK